MIEQTLGNGRGMVLGMVVLALAPSFLRGRGVRFHPFDPETFVPLLYFLSSGYAPTSHLLLSSDLRLGELELAALTVAFIGAVACALVCTIASNPPERSTPPTDGASEVSSGAETELTITSVDRAAILAGLLGMVMIAIYVASVGLDALMSMSYGETYLAEQGWGSLVAGWQVINVVTVYLVGRCTVFRRAGKAIPRLLLGMIGLFVVAFAWNSLMGRRGPLVWLVVSVILAAHVRGIALRRIWFAAGVAVLMLYSFAIEGMRNSLGQGASSQLDAAQRRLEKIDNPLVIGELEGVWNTIVIVVTENPSLVAYPGESIVAAVLLQVPAPIWPDRPTGMSVRFVRWVDPTMARAGGGYAFNATAEGYVNFGETGTALEIILMTALAFVPISRCIRRRRWGLQDALVVCITSFAYNEYRGEFAVTLKNFLALLAGVVTIDVIDRTIRFVARQRLPRHGDTTPGARPAAALASTSLARSK
jgi:hypothetical protein